ncbi:hypothetical protein [Bradyrhizobium sp.]|uniref:hypothetical protein n=1 Tax=Bradyrhizobium sp. TaxID=376 RepID=UPI0025BFCA62|nr:hypothetical protein [Bradyrhizobium sp.]
MNHPRVIHQPGIAQIVLWTAVIQPTPPPNLILGIFSTRQQAFMRIPLNCIALQDKGGSMAPNCVDGRSLGERHVDLRT